MTWTAPLCSTETGLVDRSRVRWTALFGSIVLTFAGGLSYLGSLVWAANWPVFESDSVAHAVHVALLVFLAAWTVVGSLAGVVFQRSTLPVHAGLAIALWFAWGCLGPIRAVSLALFAMAALAAVAFVRPFMRAARAGRATVRRTTATSAASRTTRSPDASL